MAELARRQGQVLTISGNASTIDDNQTVVTNGISDTGNISTTGAITAAGPITLTADDGSQVRMEFELLFGTNYTVKLTKVT